MRPSQIACARCGRAVPVDELSLWQQDEQIRVFRGPGRRDQDGSPTRGVYDRVRKRRAYLTCAPCHARLEAGGSLDDIHDRKVILYAAAVVALGVLIIIMTPIVMPGLLIAFWRW